MGLNSSRRTFLSALFVVACGASAWAQTGPQTPTGTWATEGTQTFYCYGGGSTTDDTSLYMVGGYDLSGPYTPQYYSQFHRYNPATNVWDAGLPYTYIRAPYPVGSTTIVEAGIQGNSLGYYNGYLYSFGGIFYITVNVTGYTAVYGCIMRYNLATNSGTWEWVMAPGGTSQLLITGNRYYLAGNASMLNNKFYLVGGYNQAAGSTTLGTTPVSWAAGYSNLMNEFDPALVGNATTSPLRIMTPMLYTRYYPAAAAVPNNGKFYVMAGLSNTAPQYSNTCEEFTPPTTSAPYGSWLTRATFTFTNNATYPGNYGSMAVGFANRVYMIGGYAPVSPNYFPYTFEYNTSTNTWTQRASMASGRYQVFPTAVISANEGGVTKPRVYVFGSASGVYTIERYEPPEFGSPPNEPTAVGQAGARPETALQALADPNQFDGWTNTQVSFSANVTDPDANQTVRFRVQVKPAAAGWTQTSAIVSLDSGLGAQGVRTVNWTIPTGGGFDWRWRVEDAFGNSYPVPGNTWVEAFGTLASPNTTSPDFRSDQIPPADPVAVSPTNVDIQVPSPAIGDVTLSWTQSTDNGPVLGISYEVQVATDGGFQGIEAQLFSTAGTSSYPVALSVSRYDKFWRIRARDIGGNLSNWSPPLAFRVTHNDGLDHSAGDAKKFCGFSASASPAMAAALLGVLVLAFALRRKLSSRGT